MRRDVLVAYAGLLRYKPRPSREAICYDGLLALRSFGPNVSHAADVLEACAMSLRKAPILSMSQGRHWGRCQGFELHTGQQTASCAVRVRASA